MRLSWHELASLYYMLTFHTHTHTNVCNEASNTMSVAVVQRPLFSCIRETGRWIATSRDSYTKTAPSNSKPALRQRRENSKARRAAVRDVHPPVASRCTCNFVFEERRASSCQAISESRERLHYVCQCHVHVYAELNEP